MNDNHKIPAMHLGEAIVNQGSASVHKRRLLVGVDDEDAPIQKSPIQTQTFGSWRGGKKRRRCVVNPLHRIHRAGPDRRADRNLRMAAVASVPPPPQYAQLWRPRRGDHIMELARSATSRASSRPKEPV